MARKRAGKQPSIVIRREEIVEAAHHGGAWKVAYADFVTAMMAFFLLMWLINATTDAQRRGLADYFSPTNRLAQASSGVGKPFGGATPYDQGALLSDRGALQVVNGTKNPSGLRQATSSPSETDQQHGSSGPPLPVRVIWPAPKATSAPVASVGAPMAPAQAADAPSAPHPTGASTGARAEEAAEAAAQEQTALTGAADAIRRAVASDPTLHDVAHQIAVDVTPDGLRIQIMDRDGKPMFASGSAMLEPAANALLRQVAPVLSRLSEQLAISGYTDAAPLDDHGRSNWDLSASRANAARRVLAEAGLPDQRFEQVAGYGARDLLLPAEPLAAANRRVVIVVHRRLPPPPSP